MRLLYPEFLWALFIIAIPIIIHLYNFRKLKKVYFSDISLLEEIQIETKSKSRLKEILVLISRILALSCLVLAFCFPYIPNNKNSDNKDKSTVAIYINNSLSMDLTNGLNSSLELSKNQAKNVIQQYSSNTRFYLLTNSKNSIFSRDFSKSEITELINEIKIGTHEVKIENVYLKQIEQLKSHNTAEIYWLSDLQKSSMVLDNIKLDSNHTINIIPYNNKNVGNLYIDSIWFETPTRSLNKQEELFVKLVNNYSYDIDFNLNLEINNNQSKGLTKDYIKANSSIITSIKYIAKEAGTINCKLKINNYPEPNLTFDDTYYFSYLLNEKIAVLCIVENENDTNYVSSLLSTSNDINLTTQAYNKLDYEIINKQDLIIINGINNINLSLSETIKDYIKQGNTIAFFPSIKASLDTYNELYKNYDINWLAADSSYNTLSKLNTDQTLLKNVFRETKSNIDLPKIKYRYILNINSKSNTEKLINFKDEYPFLLSTDFGQIYTFTSPLSEKAGNFIKHALFVPILLRISETAGKTSKLSYIINKDEEIISSFDFTNIENINIKCKTCAGENSFIPGIKYESYKSIISIYKQIKEDGNYNIYQDSLKVDCFSFNYSRKESKMDFYSINGIKNNIDLINFKKNIKLYEANNNLSYIDFANKIKDTKYWLYFILLTLLFLCFEILLLRLIK